MLVLVLHHGGDLPHLRQTLVSTGRLRCPILQTLRLERGTRAPPPLHELSTRSQTSACVLDEVQHMLLTSLILDNCAPSAKNSNAHMAEYTFIQQQFHPMNFSSNDIFIQ